MSLFGSLFAGVAGLSSQSRSMGMISDNIANVNTTAYKGALAQFSSLVTRQPGSSTYTPGGVRVAGFQNISKQGLVQNTESPTDVAISGAGFFVVNTAATAGGEQLYTRAGAFSPDSLGNLRTASGQYLQGWRLDASGQIADINTLETVSVRQTSGVAAATTAVEIGANLNAGQTAFTGVYAAGDMADYVSSGAVTGVQPHFMRNIRVFDSLGGPHDVTLAFLKDAAANTWNAEIFADPAGLDQPPHPATGLIASGTIQFNGDGSLGAASITPVVSGVLNGPVDIQWLAAGGADPSTVTFDFGTVGATNGFTQFWSPTDVAFVTQDGAAVGEISSVRIDEDGVVVASYTNSQLKRLFRLPIATFANPPGLEPRSGNVYALTAASGDVSLRQAGASGAGRVMPSALEGANVDLADEFTKMIVTQRAYSANAKVVSTSDEMLDELIRIKR